MTRSFHKQKEVPHKSEMRLAGATKTNPNQLKKSGSGGKGAWGSTQDEILDAKHIINSGDLPARSPEIMRKLSISSTSTSSSTESNAENVSPIERIVEDASEGAYTTEPASTLEKAVAGAST